LRPIVGFRPKLNAATPHQNIKDNRIIAIAMQPAKPAINEPRLGPMESSKDKFSSLFADLTQPSFSMDSIERTIFIYIILTVSN
jgi:hypothetical protein